jgi:signal transduction histidine kinase
MDDRDLTGEDLGAALSDAITVVNRAFPERSIAIRSAIPMGKHFVKANTFLRDLFVNILSNAVKFDQSKRVRVDVSVSMAQLTNGEYWLVSVVDRGRGIPDDRKTAVFERFATGETGVKGFGLGLSIVRTVVDRFGGRIWVEDRIEGDFSKGAVFKILLPKAESSEG